MTTFILIASAMVVTALAWVLVPLLKRTRKQSVASDALNVAILRDQVSELESDIATGAMPRERYDEARRELDRRVLDDSASLGTAASPPSQAAAWTAAVLAGTIPIVALVLYAVLGSHEAFNPASQRADKGGPEHDVTRQQVEAMAEKLAARLEKEPEKVEGWVMLARTYDALDRHGEAVKAFERAVALAPENAAILADYADSVGAAEGGINGKAQELVDRALKADPTHWKALALAGTGAFERKDYQQAIVYWESLKATVPQGSPIAGTIDASIAEARNLAQQNVGNAKRSATVATAKSAPATSEAPTTAQASTAGPGATIAGTVSLAPTLVAKVAPTDTVFIFARAVDGPKMPLAILRKRVQDLPLRFTLDDSMAMSPNFALSSVPAVVVVARVSKSGGAAPQSGDFEGMSSSVKAGAKDVSIVIDRALP